MMANAVKPRAGAALLTAEWFLEVGLQTGLAARVEQDIRRVLAALERSFELIYPGPISTVEQAVKAGRRFRAEGAELLILVHVLWSEDGPLVRLLREASGLPILLWCYNPYDRLPVSLSPQDLFRASGPVGFLQGSAPLARLGLDFTYVFGSPEDEGLARELADCARAFAIRSALPSLRIGQLGPRCGAMAGGYVDEFRLLAKLGVSLVPLSAWRLAKQAEDLPAREVQAFVRDLKARYRVIGVSDRSLELAARASLALASLVEGKGLGALAIEDLNPELHLLLKTRPCLWVPALRERGAVVGMEADIGATLGLWLARQAGESSPMYTEIFTFDREANALLFGHAGIHDPALAGSGEVTLVPDAEYAAADEVEGAWLSFAARPGPVTAVSLFAGAEDCRLTVFQGEVLPTKGKLEAFPHAFVRIQRPLADFFEKAARLGLTQHFALSYDPVAGRLEKLCRILGWSWAAL
jgi:L-fucose isomerase-like protein